MHVLDVVGVQSSELNAKSHKSQIRNSSSDDFQRHFDKELGQKSRKPVTDKEEANTNKPVHSERRPETHSRVEKEGQGVAQKEGSAYAGSKTSEESEAAFAQGELASSPTDEMSIVEESVFALTQDQVISDTQVEIDRIQQASLSANESQVEAVQIPFVSQLARPVKHEPLASPAHILGTSAEKISLSQVNADPIKLGVALSDDDSRPMPSASAQAVGLLHPQQSSTSPILQTQKLSTTLSFDQMMTMGVSSDQTLKGDSALNANLITQNMATGAALTEKLPGLDLAAGQVDNGRFNISIQVGRPEWSSAVANKVAEMAARNLSSAEIQLDPPELGPLQVKVQVVQEQAAVSFSSHSQQVREALDQGSQRLREMLESEGLDLVDVDVRDQQQDEQSADEEHAGVNSSGQHHADGEEGVTNDEGPSAASRIQMSAGVDDYV